MFLYRSNRLETLAVALAELCRPPLASPFSRECIVVQSRGMATWLAMRLADTFGVWANPDFPHPRQLVERLLFATLGDGAVRAADWNRDRLALAILEELPLLLAQPEFAPLARYFASGHDDLKQLQLAERIASVFDQYAVFRPEMVLEWEAGEAARSGREQQWQPVLWRAVARRLVSPARLYGEAFEALRAGSFRDRAALPERLFLFAITTLPPLYLTLLAELALHLPVHLLLFSPAEEYWGEMASTGAAAHLLRRSPSGGRAEELHLDVGHPLLASLGSLGRDFQVLLEERLAGVLADHALFVAHERPRTLLHLVQDDILFLRHRHHRATEPECQPVLLADTDDSLVIHCCHSPLREVEILHDQLLAMIGRENLTPADIAVMVPDIDTYAPFIEAVFGRDQADPRFIPFLIADRAIGREAPLVEAFFSLLSLLAGRLAAPQVLDFLGFAPARERFAIAAAELPTLERWSAESGIRWGIDEADRARHGQPAERQNTWSFGFDRLLLGYALPLGERSCWQGVLPYDEVEGQDADLLGRFLACGNALFAWAARSGEPLTLVAWHETVAAMLAGFFRQGPNEEWQQSRILDAAAALAADAERVGTAAAFTLPAYGRLLRARLEEGHRDHGFLQGGVTFCAMLPMRTIPFTVICLLGLDDGAFPRLSHAVSFDLVAASPRRGDRSRRNDDRYLFLEALLAARQRLYLSYVGRSSRDNARLAPSVVVDELLDAVAGSVHLAGGEPGSPPLVHRQRVAARLTVHHPLQPFSPGYFDNSDPRLMSFATEYHAAARAGAAPAQELPAFAAGLPPLAVGGEGDFSLAGLRRFYRNPARFFCQSRLALLLHDAGETLPEREPLILDALERYEVGGLLLAEPGEEALAAVAVRLQAKGALPAGHAGPAILQGLWRQLAPIRARLEEERQGASPATLAIDLPLSSGGRLLGEVAERYPRGLLRWRPGRLRPAFLLACWLDHLALCAAADDAVQTVMICRGEQERAAVARFRPVAEAVALLDELVHVQYHGLARPLPFFPLASHAYAVAMAAGKNEEAARRAAWVALSRAPFGSEARPEGDDPYVRKAFGRAPLSDGAVAREFGALASGVFGPLLDHLEQSP